tara:strand:+ start:39586 stop:40554 length:969 start_codon:yes stop_codon:yes gene_type:complete
MGDIAKFGRNAELAIVVGTLNRLEHLKNCIESIQSETKFKHVIYVSDAGSTDGTIEYLRSIQSETIVPIFEGKRVGQALAYNSIFHTIEAPFTCWLSDDNVVVNRGLDRAVKILKAEPKIGMVALKVKDRIGPLIKAPYIGGISSLGILNVNQGVLRTNELQAIGGFSEVFKDYGIDPDLTAKTLLQGLDVVYLRDIAVYHDRCWSEDETSEEFKRLKVKHERFHRLYQDKYANLLPSSRAYEMKKRLWTLLKDVFLPGHSINSHEPVFGLLMRDWLNIFTGRFISLADPILCAGKDYYLRQKIRGALREIDAPADPIDVNV